MNINQVGLASQKTEKGQESTLESMQLSKAAEKVKGTGRFVLQSGLINQLAQGTGTYGRNVKEDENKSDTGAQSKSELDCLGEIKDRITEEDAQDLEEEGMSLEKYNAQRLEKALNRIKENRQAKRDSVEQTSQKREEQNEDIKQAAVQNGVESADGEKVAAALANANLPLTQENVDKITQAMNMAGNACSLSDEGRKYLISNEMDLTISNVYHAEYSAAGTGKAAGNGKATDYEAANVAYDVDGSSNQKNSAGDWEFIKEQAEEVISDAGLEVNDKTIAQCQWLFENNLPVSKEALGKLNTIETIQKNFNQNDLLQGIIKNYETGTQPEDTSLDSIANKEASEEASKFLQEIEKQLSSSENTIQDISARRQLEEIRLKMTTEVSQKLIEKGIKLDTSNLSEIVEGLKQIEKDYYRSMMEESQADMPEGADQLLQETTEKVNALGSVPAYTLGKTFGDRAVQTVDSLYETGSAMQSEMERAGESYENLKTEVRKDLGDSIQKAFRGIDSILDDLGLENTESNRRAVRILGYNNIEITNESVAEMKNYDSKVQSLMSGLKPAVTMEMIKRGINPLDASIDQVNQEVEEISQEIGVSEDEKYSEFLWKLDQKKTLDADERKAFIGLYRLMNQVADSDGAAIGSVIKAGQDLTLSNLLTAVRTSKSSGIDTSVGDDFGVLENIISANESITEQVQYYRNKAQQIMNKMTPDNLAQAAEKLRSDIQGDTETIMESLQGVSLERLDENIEVEEESSKSYFREKLDFYYEKLGNSQEYVKFLQSADVPVTLENAASANSLLYENVWEQIVKKAIKEPEQKEKYKNAIQKLSDNLGEESFEEEYDEFTRSSQTVLEQSVSSEENTFSDISLLHLLGCSLQLAGTMSKKETYSIPIVTGDKIADVNVVLEHKNSNQGRVRILYKSDTLGEVESEWSIRTDTAKGFIAADNVAALDLMKQQKESVESAVGELGLTAQQINFGLSQNRRQQLSAAESAEGSTDTRVLLKVAKVFIKTIQKVEQIKERG